MQSGLFYLANIHSFLLRLFNNLSSNINHQSRASSMRPGSHSRWSAFGIQRYWKS
jgi:hypothetical protein